MESAKYFELTRKREHKNKPRNTPLPKAKQNYLEAFENFEQALQVFEIKYEKLFQFNSTKHWRWVVANYLTVDAELYNPDHDHIAELLHDNEEFLAFAWASQACTVKKQMVLGQCEQVMFSDHAYMTPPEVTIKLGWSESAGKLNNLLGNSFIAGSPSLIAIYEA